MNEYHKVFWPNKKFSLVLGRYTEIPYRYPIFWNIDTDADVGIRNTEKYRIPTIKYRKYRFGICLQGLRIVFILLLDESQVGSKLIERRGLIRIRFEFRKHITYCNFEKRCCHSRRWRNSYYCLNNPWLKHFATLPNFPVTFAYLSPLRYLTSSNIVTLKSVAAFEKSFRSLAPINEIGGWS